MRGNMTSEKDKRLSDTDRKLGIKLVPCKNCNMEFHTLHREDNYCAFCVAYKGFKNSERPKKRRR